MDARAARNEIRMASWVWGIHDWNLADAGDCGVHPQPGEASCKKELCPRMENVLEAARTGRERGLKSAVPDGTRDFFRANPAVPAGLLSVAPIGARINFMEEEPGVIGREGSVHRNVKKQLGF